MNENDYKIVEAMSKYGGRFVRMLAELARHADNSNLQKIKSTWQEYWLEYEKTISEYEKIINESKNEK